MKIEWKTSEVFGIDKGFLENLVVNRHYLSLDFLSKEMGFDRNPKPVGKIIFAPGEGSVYYMAEGIKEAEEDTIKIGVIRESSKDSEIVTKIKWDVVHETAHHLHYKKNPRIIKNYAWGRGLFITYPLSNWYLREIIAEYSTLLFYNYNKEKFLFEFFPQFFGRIEPVLKLYSSDKTLLKELIESDELKIPKKFMGVIRKMEVVERRGVGLDMFYASARIRT